MSSKFQLQNLQQVFIIAEIGQNHQGDLEIAKILINMAKVTMSFGTSNKK